MHEAPPFPFFLGCKRSGTTLLRVIFDSNPELAVPVEAYFPMVPEPSWLDTAGRPVPHLVADGLAQKGWFKKMRLPSDALPAAIERDAPETYPDLIRCLYRLYAEAQQKPRYGNKTPRHVIYIPHLAGMFVEARFVHIIRDGRDVALSLLDVDREIPDLRAASRFWRDRVLKGHSDGERLGEERYREVFYEELLDDPEGELRSLCAFLALEYDDAMLRYYERIPDMVIGEGKHLRLTRPPTKGLRDWRVQMTSEDIAAIEDIAGDALDTFGYERSGIARSSRDRLRSGVADHLNGVRRRVRGVRRHAAGRGGGGNA